MMKFKKIMRKLLWKAGYDVIQFSPMVHPVARQKKLFESYCVDTVIDVGANKGQFAEMTRNELGYKGKIISFEPLQSAFKVLEEKSSKDPKWDIHQYALGDSISENEINVSENSHSSSILNLLPSHLKEAPSSKYIGRQTIQVKTLDSIFTTIAGGDGQNYLKIDTQGFEKQVIQGAKKSLPKIQTVQLEMSLQPLYEGEALFDEMISLLSKHGFQLVSVENGLTDQQTGHLLQMDGIFHRL